MDNLVFLILIVQFIIIIALCINTFKEQIKTFQLGIRRRTAFFIDIREKARITLSTDLKQFKYNGLTYIWNNEKEKSGSCMYVLGNAEALDIYIDVDKCKYWCDSNEYNTVLKNNLLETLMMLKSKDTIILFLVIGIIISVVVLALVYFRTGTIINDVTAIQNSINAMNQTTDTFIRR